MRRPLPPSNLFHVLIRCISQYCISAFAWSYTRQGRVLPTHSHPLPPPPPLPPPYPFSRKGSAWSHELPGPRKPPVINYAAAPLCRCLSARWVCSQSFVSGFARSSDPLLCTEVRRGAPLGQVRTCSNSQSVSLSQLGLRQHPSLPHSNLSEQREQGVSDAYSQSTQL